VYAKDGQITILISGEKFNLRNYWSGRWSSEYNVSNISGTNCRIRFWKFWWFDWLVEMVDWVVDWLRWLLVDFIMKESSSSSLFLFLSHLSSFFFSYSKLKWIIDLACSLFWRWECPITNHQKYRRSSSLRFWIEMRRDMRKLRLDWCEKVRDERFVERWLMIISSSHSLFIISLFQ